MAQNELEKALEEMLAQRESLDQAIEGLERVLGRRRRRKKAAAVPKDEPKNGAKAARSAQLERVKNFTETQAKQSAAMKASWAKLTPKEREKRIEGIRKAAKKRRNQQNPEQAARVRAHWENLTPKERAARQKAMREGQARSRARKEAKKK